MTLRTKTLTAVAALTIFASGYSLAQEAETTEQPTEEQQPASENGSDSEATTATDEGADAEPTAESEEAADDGADEEPAADEAASDEPAAGEETAPEEDTAEPAAEAVEAEDDQAAPDEAVEDEPAEEGASEAEAEEPAAEEAAAEEPAAEAEAADEHESSDEGGAEEEHTEDGGHGSVHIEDIDFSFEGPFGKYDQFQLQRGLQVYTEVCAACHGMKFVPIRTLHNDGGPGLPEDQVRAYAANMTIVDKETGEERPRLPTDHFPTVTGDGMGPDLSLMAKARAGFHGPYGTGINQLFKGIGGPEYIHAILTGYTGEEVEQAGTFLYENTAYATGALSMPPPLSDDLVTYEDGTPATVDQMARDVSAFLMWTAEPKLADRKQVGFVAVLFLIVLTALLYLTNKRLWAPHKGKSRKS